LGHRASALGWLEGGQLPQTAPMKYDTEEVVCPPVDRSVIVTLTEPSLSTAELGNVNTHLIEPCVQPETIVGVVPSGVMT